MPNPAEPQTTIEVVEGPTFIREIEQFPHAKDDVQKVLNQIVIPAVKSNPILPHEAEAGTPVIRGVLTVRVPDSSGGTGKRGGYRLYYHWDRHKHRLTKLSIALRRDRASLAVRAVDKLLTESGAGETSKR
jgi:mRNA-degrading endonuclease RelE of RelBE toxin-antitoxin system